MPALFGGKSPRQTGVKEQHQLLLRAGQRASARTGHARFVGMRSVILRNVHIGQTYPLNEDSDVHSNRLNWQAESMNGKEFDTRRRVNDFAIGPIFHPHTPAVRETNH